MFNNFRNFECILFYFVLLTIVLLLMQLSIHIQRSVVLKDISSKQANV